MELEKLEKYLDETTQIIQDAKLALANETKSAGYALVARAHLELLRKALNRANDNDPMMEDFPQVPA